MDPSREVVVTGMGIVSPIGVGKDAFWKSLREGRSGVGTIDRFKDIIEPKKFGGRILDFDPKEFVVPRKSLKVMSRDSQFAFAAAQMAWDDSGLIRGVVDPERFGVIFGADFIYLNEQELIEPFRSCIVDGEFQQPRWGTHAMSELYPLWLLKHLPNMPTCHIGISFDARGHNNTISHGDVSSLEALAEAVRVIQRRAADVMLIGGVGQRIHHTVIYGQKDDFMSHRHEDPAGASRPFDADRDGFVYGEGGAAYILESRRHAEARGAKILARVLSTASACEPVRRDRLQQGTAIVRTIQKAVADAGFTPHQIGHVNAHGVSTIHQDRIEARAICETLGEVPVTAPKSLFGNLGAGSGAVEMAASILSFETGEVPATLNYRTPDPECPVRVIHREPHRAKQRTAIILNQAPRGQAIAVVIAAP